MISLGLFEKINSNIENHFGIVVTDRIKVEVKLYKPNEELEEEKPKFNLWKFLGLK